MNLGTLPDTLTLQELQDQAFETACEKGWHDEDSKPPSEVVQAIAAKGLQLAELCDDVERLRKGQPVEPGSGAGPDGCLGLVRTLSPAQTRALAWLTLICTEAAEAMEDVLANRWELAFDADGKPTGLPSELADIGIRLGDSSSAWGVDLTGACATKLAYNRTRDRRHGGKLA